MILNRDLSIDAAVKHGPWQNIDVSASDPANKLPLFCDSDHDVYIVAIESVVTKVGDTNGADVVVSIGSVATPALVGTVTVQKAATPAISTAVKGTLADPTEKTHEGRNGVRIPKGTPIFASYTNSAANIAERGVRLSYVVCDENYTD